MLTVALVDCADLDGAVARYAAALTAAGFARADGVLWRRPFDARHRIELALSSGRHIGDGSQPNVTPYADHPERMYGTL